MRWLLLSALLFPFGAQAADPSALWKIVNGKCVPHEEAAHDASPCAEVDIALGVDKGYALLKDIRGVAQFLLIPTARLSGIEDPMILAPEATNYWDAAWKAHYFVEERLNTSLPRNAISLAINSASGRSQDQLHIHIDCIRPDIQATIAANIDKISEQWSPFPLAGHNYRAVRIDQDSLDGLNPFKLLEESGPTIDMGKHTLVLVGAKFSDSDNGFILLDDQVDLATGDVASGEELQDHDCKIAPR